MQATTPVLRRKPSTLYTATSMKTAILRSDTLQRLSTHCIGIRMAPGRFCGLRAMPHMQAVRLYAYPVSHMRSTRPRVWWRGVRPGARSWGLPLSLLRLYVSANPMGHGSRIACQHDFRSGDS